MAVPFSKAVGIKLVENRQLDTMQPKPTFFPTPADFRACLETHHDKFQELFVGFHKKSSGNPSITWPESVDGALCVGSIPCLPQSLTHPTKPIPFTPPL